MSNKDRNARRRARHALRKAAELEQRHQMEIALAREVARREGHAAGRLSGAQETRNLVLHHAGRLYQAGEDDAAKAVRDVHRLLSKNGVDEVNAAAARE
jgi:hypothetical protein